MVARWSYAVAGALSLALCDASAARAYCRTYTKDGAETACPFACQRQGIPLAWRRPHVDYVFNVKGFPMLSDAALRGTFARSFAAWERVHCDGEPTPITSRAKPGTTTGLNEPPPESTENVIMHFTAREWSSRGYSPQAFAITAVWYNPNSGEIYGADMMFNGRMDPFGVCPDDPDACRRSEVETDLQNVATHEIGHLLGLSHSDVPASTMWCDADTKEISKRDLAADDIEGICAVYPPARGGGGGGGPDGDDTDADEGCRVTGRGASSSLAPLLAALLAVGLARRRRGG